MSTNGINSGLAFLAGAAVMDGIEADVNKVKNQIKFEALERQLAAARRGPVQVGVTPDSKKRIANIAEQLIQNEIECNAKIAENRANDTAKINNLNLLVSETRELANAWEERSVVQEAQKDSWLVVIRNLLTTGKITISKDEVNKKYLENYEPLIETNLAAMRTKHQSR